MLNDKEDWNKSEINKHFGGQHPPSNERQTLIISDWLVMSFAI